MKSVVKKVIILWRDESDDASMQIFHLFKKYIEGNTCVKKSKIYFGFLTQEN